MSERSIKCTAFSPELIKQKKSEKRPLNRYTTVLFEEEAEYARFLEWVFDEYGGPRGLRFTNSAIPGTVRVGPGLLEVAHDKFSMREADGEDERRYLATLKGTRPFDPKDWEGRHIFGLGHFKKRDR